jgi:hypothetical protein
MARTRTRWRCGAGIVALGLAVACGDRAESPAPAPAPAAAPEANAPHEAAEAPTAAPAKVESNLVYLRAQVGKYPRDIQLFDTEPLHARLVALVGDRYPALVENFGTQGPLSADGPVLYAIGAKPHAAGDEQAILLVDLDRDLVNVKLMDTAEMQEFRERSEAVELPGEVQTTIANWEDLAGDTE